ncbi:hypothetical protein OK016_07990 [Vibrio chagasii]|nr:hypothetical protein [Vibrio chagasii]
MLFTQQLTVTLNAILLADGNHCGPARGIDSYLNIPRIISAAGDCRRCCYPPWLRLPI